MNRQAAIANLPRTTQQGTTSFTRRSFIHGATALSATIVLPGRATVMASRQRQEELASCIESAHQELWRRFVTREGVIIDYAREDGTVPLPTPEECAVGKPNALGWFSPIENGALFGGFYLPAMCSRWRSTRKDEDKEKARKIARGLLLLASVSDVPGFIARGVSTDGRSHYPCSSDDQTHPWFLGLYKYLQSGIPGADEKRTIVEKMKEVASANERKGWRLACEGPLKGQSFGNLKGGAFRDVTKLLFILRAMYEVTGDSHWFDAYLLAATEKLGEGNTRLEICAGGRLFDSAATKDMVWLTVHGQLSLKELATLRSEEGRRNYFVRGLTRNAEDVTPWIRRCKEFDNANDAPFRFFDWRQMNGLWKPHATTTEARQLAKAQLDAMYDLDLKRQVKPRHWLEYRIMRDTLSAAHIVALSGDATIIDKARDDIEDALCHFDWRKLNLSLFFLAECAYYALKDADLEQSEK